MGKINAEWHLAHRMPKNPTIDERLGWHVAHAKNCDCREMSDKIKLEIEEWKKDK